VYAPRRVDGPSPRRRKNRTQAWQADEKSQENLK
jgi:hypothetical protein